MDSKTSTTPTAGEPPTTYVQADTHTFRDLVQRLTGGPAPSKPSAAAVGPRRQAFKLNDRRGSSVRSLEVKLGLASVKSPTSVISRSPTPSPVTPLAEAEEERVIKEKGVLPASVTARHRTAGAADSFSIVPPQTAAASRVSGFS